MGVGNRPWVLGTAIYEEIKLQRGKDWSEPVLNTGLHAPCSSTLNQIFCIPLFNPVAKKPFVQRENIAEGHMPLPAKLHLCLNIYPAQFVGQILYYQPTARNMGYV